MLINLRNALMGGTRLPYDAEVEYLEATGTQYIDTGRPIPADFWFDATMDITGTSSAYKILLGARVGSGNKDYEFAFESNNNRFLARYGTSTSQYMSSIPTGMTRIRVESGGKLYINESFEKQLGVGLPSEHNVYIFALNNNGTVSTWARYIRLYSLKYGGLNEDHDLIPVRKGTVGYLYDRVSGKLFGNAGTGDFVLGPDVVPVEYIESHGAEYIETGIVPSGQTRWELDVTFPDVLGFRPMGAIATNPTRRFVIAREQGSTTYGVSFGSYDNIQKDINSGIRRLCVIDAPNSAWSIGARSGTFTEGTFDISGIGSICLFIRKRNSDHDYPNDGSRVHRSALYTSGSRIQDLLPVRVGTEGAMMDTLTRRIYRNAGTGAFTYGNDLKYPIPAA